MKHTKMHTKCFSYGDFVFGGTLDDSQSKDKWGSMTQQGVSELNPTATLPAVTPLPTPYAAVSSEILGSRSYDQPEQMAILEDIIRIRPPAIGTIT